MNKELLQKITSRKEYSQLPRKEVELAFQKFDKEKYSDEEKVKLTRKLLREVFSSFTSPKLLSLKDKNPEWILRKHFSTRERLPYSEEVYSKLLGGLNKNLSVIDLGAGINGFSYEIFKKIGYNVNYLAVEAMGQLVELMNFYFDKQKVSANAVQESLFELEKIKDILKKQKKPRVVFLFKVIDSLEMLEKDYSKEFLLGIGEFAERIVVSFAVKSMGNRIRFRANRDWILDFIKENFKIIEDFEIGGERYLVFSK